MAWVKVAAFEWEFVGFGVVGAFASVAVVAFAVVVAFVFVVAVVVGCKSMVVVYLFVVRSGQIDRHSLFSS